MSRCSVIRFKEHGDQVALGRLVQANLRMVVGYAKRFRHLGVPLLDLIHEGNLGLIEAARRSIPRRHGFQAASLWWIRQAMMHLLSESGRAVDTDSRACWPRRAGPPGRGDPRRARYAQSAAAGKEIKEPPVADAEDFAAHLREEGRRKSIRKARKRRKLDASELQVLRSTASFVAI